jgi:GNAT superfamily N-acetyltransferase
MVASEALEAVALLPADVAGGVALSSGAGWNQTADDWAWFVAQGHASGIHADDGRLVATAAAAAYGERAWISMVLVDPAWRHRGLASRLMERTLARLKALGVTPVLDATPAGEAVYRRLGFRAGFALERWQGVAATTGERLASGTDSATGVHRPSDVGLSNAAARRATLADLDTVAALDRAANGLDRRDLLRAFLARPGTRAWLGVDGGFVIVRVGTRALQIGPLVAREPVAAQRLLATALDAIEGPVFLDVPTRWPTLEEWLEARGFVRQRAFVRMDLGAPQPIACDDRSFVLAGPEFG